MYQTPDILATAYRQPVMAHQLVPLREKERQIPGSVQYSIKRYGRIPQWSLDDMGEMVYHYSKEDSTLNFLELRFCIATFSEPNWGSFPSVRTGVPIGSRRFLSSGPPAREFVRDEVFFRILLFKLFNKIETWELLSTAFGAITLSNFEPREYDRELSKSFAWDAGKFG